MAYADWAGLRPMTEFEFTKAARGSSDLLESGLPWDTKDKNTIQRLPDHAYNLNMVNGWDESMLNDSSRVLFGASFYWVMDLAGSVWERLITVGHPKGRSFTGVHGDGNITESGDADVSDWPSSQDEGGIGYRGGGFYGYDRSYHEFNPYSPVAYRRFGGWHGHHRVNAYGTRFVRTFQ